MVVYGMFGRDPDTLRTKVTPGEPPTIQSAHAEATSVRAAGDEDVPALARALARAFYDDPVMLWLMPDDEARLRRLEPAFDLYLRRMWMPKELSFTTDGLTGGACWLPPGEWHLSVPRQLAMMPGMIAAFRGRLPRALRAFNFMESRHPKAPHYYLHVVGVDPDWQGRGLGGALMAPILRRCDDEGLPAYLEASSPRNRVLYERNGFRVVEEVPLPGGGPPLARMWREPQSRSSSAAT
jgi:GNAT superfamily N-acetyltransferase